MKIQVFLVSKVSFEETCNIPDRGEKKKKEKEKRMRAGSGEQSGDSVLIPQWWWEIAELCSCECHPLPPEALFSGDLVSCTDA